MIPLLALIAAGLSLSETPRAQELAGRLGVRPGGPRPSAWQRIIRHALHTHRPLSVRLAADLAFGVNVMGQGLDTITACINNPDYTRGLQAFLDGRGTDPQRWDVQYPPNLYKPYFEWMCGFFDRLLRLPQPPDRDIRISVRPAYYHPGNRQALGVIWSAQDSARALSALPREQQNRPWMVLPQGDGPPAPSLQQRVTGEWISETWFPQAQLNTPSPIELRLVPDQTALWDFHGSKPARPGTQHIKAELLGGDISLIRRLFIEVPLTDPDQALEAVKSVVEQQGIGLQSTPAIFQLGHPPPDGLNAAMHALLSIQQCASLRLVDTVPLEQLPDMHWRAWSISWLNVLINRIPGAVHPTLRARTGIGSAPEAFLALAILGIIQQGEQNLDYATSDEGRAALRSGEVHDLFDLNKRTASWHALSRRKAMAEARKLQLTAETTHSTTIDTPWATLTLLPLATPGSLTQESALMDHCIGTASIYKTRLRKRQATYWSVRGTPKDHWDIAVFSEIGKLHWNDDDETLLRSRLPIDADGRIALFTLEVMDGRVLQCKMTNDRLPGHNLPDEAERPRFLEMAMAVIDALKAAGFVTHSELPSDLKRFEACAARYNEPDFGPIIAIEGLHEHSPAQEDGLSIKVIWEWKKEVEWVKNGDVDLFSSREAARSRAVAYEIMSKGAQ